MEAKQQKLRKEVLFTQVRVKTKEAGGSGTVIYSGKGNRGYSTIVLTCHHVIESALKVKKEYDSKIGMDRKKEYRQVVTVEFFDYESIPHGRRPVSNSVDADIMAYDKSHDMAILKLRINTKADYIAKLLPEDIIETVFEGDKTYAVGCALLHDPILTEGMITHMGDEKDYKDYWMSSAQIIFGNCLPADSRVYCNPGIKQIAEVMPGDMVYSLTPSGTWARKRVLKLIRSGKKQIYGIKTNTRYLKASGNHPLLTPIGWMKVENLKQGNLIAICNGLPTTTRTENKAWLWLIGLFLGDGSYRDRGKKGYEVNFAVFKPKLVRKLGHKLNKLGFGYYSNKDRGVYVKKPKGFLQKLRDELGVKTRYDNKRLPQWIYALTRDEKLLVIKGLLDSDGYNDKREDWRFELNNKYLLEDIRDLAISMGCRVSNIFERERDWEIINQVGKTYDGQSTSWSFVIFNQGKPKSRNYFQIGKVDFDKIKTIEPLDIEDTYDIEVEGTHNFIADGVLVHNSGGAMFLSRDEDYHFIGVPSLIDISGWSDPITHLGYFSPITRVYEFIRDEHYEFIIDSNFTEKQCEKIRDAIKKRAAGRRYMPIEEDEDDEGDEEAS